MTRVKLRGDKHLMGYNSEETPGANIKRVACMMSIQRIHYLAENDEAGEVQLHIRLFQQICQRGDKVR